MLNIIRSFALFFIFSLLLFSADTLAQKPESVFGQGSGESCDTNRLFLDHLRLLFYNSATNPKESKYSGDTKMIIIASLGFKETDRKYNVERLKEVKKYLVSPAVGIPDEYIILAQGEKRKDEGRVDIYYGGILQYIFTFKPKGKLFLIGGEPCMY